MSCAHMNFAAEVDVNRLTQFDGGPVTGYASVIRIRCAECGTRFQFLGLEPGYDSQGARVSIDGLEANIGLTPEGMKPNPFQRMAYNIRGSFDA